VCPAPNAAVGKLKVAHTHSTLIETLPDIETNPQGDQLQSGCSKNTMPPLHSQRMCLGRSPSACVVATNIVVPQMLLLHSWDHLNLVPKPPNSQHMLL
jgi:hypothetical protein